MTKPSRSFEELEVKIAFLEDAMSKISDEFYRQQRDIDDLKVKYLALIDKVIRGADDASQASEILDEKPPHY